MEGDGVYHSLSGILTDAKGKTQLHMFYVVFHGLLFYCVSPLLKSLLFYVIILLKEKIQRKQRSSEL